ncbi:MAG TPA: hypothetical protein VD905_16150, partial [Flavobacteriales bacterium]|nr:hypothetical protein [Flavobacteriales bacterium]
MKKIFALTAATVLMSQVFASSIYDQLVAFNPNWKKYKTHVKEAAGHNFHSDAEYVQAHLSCVISVLKSNPVDHLTTKQLRTRKHLINVLDSYLKAGIF